MDHSEIRFTVGTALAQERTAEIADRHSEEYSCVLTQTNIDHFRLEGRKLLARISTLKYEWERAKKAAADAKTAYEMAQDTAGRMSEQLLTDPPQGIFPFSGRLIYLRDHGATILLDDQGEPILETYRPATDKERAFITKHDEQVIADRQLAMFEEPTSASESHDNDEDDVKHPEDTENATEDESGQETDEDDEEPEQQDTPFTGQRRRMAN